MDITQVIHLASWYGDYSDDFIGKYTQLHNVLDHNSKQPQKQPVREPLSDLTTTLNNLPVEALTNEELTKLSDLGVLQYLGIEGARFVQDTVTSGDYDPASAAADIASAVNTLTQRKQQFSGLFKALTGLEFGIDFDEELNNQTAIRVRFRGDASIADVVLLKRWSTDWYDIMRGVAMSVGERPEQVKVVGAANGSIVLVLTGAASVTLVLAVIAKNIGKIVHEVLKIANAIEDLRHKKILNREIEKQLLIQQKKTQDEGVASTVAAVNEVLPEPMSNEIEAALTKSVKKYVAFTDKGGDVDFIEPWGGAEYDRDEGVEEVSALEGTSAELRLLHETIEEVRQTNAETKQLSYLVDDDDNTDT